MQQSLLTIHVLIADENLRWISVKTCLSKNWRNVADFPTNIYIYLQLAQKLTEVIHYMNYHVHFTSTLKNLTFFV